MTATSNIHYFLGANSPTGFYSLYDQLLKPETAQRIYIIKGGPGCGKSTLMRKVAAKAEQAGKHVDYILCSGDPDSLDAVILPELRVALVDGTAPHVVEPKYPGLVEQYLNLGECYDREGLQSVREELLHAMLGYKECYQRAYRCLAASAEISGDIRATLCTSELEEKSAKRAKGILLREVKPKKDQPVGQVTQRFLSAVTHKGQMCMFGTVLEQCSRIYELYDNYGLSNSLLSHLLSGITARGYDVVACPSPMAPERLEHLIVPELGLAFVTSTNHLSLPTVAYRRLRIDAMVDPDLLRRSRPRMRFFKKVSAALIDEAVAALAQAKTLHDDLEDIYNPHVDFDEVNYRAKLVIEEILGT